MIEEEKRRGQKSLKGENGECFVVVREGRRDEKERKNTTMHGCGSAA